MCEKKCTLGIFSREDRSCYQWLSQSLEFSSAVKSVTHCHISNNFPAFQDEVISCTFAILYHTKNRGRLNLTDVTDSLYDRELKHLHDKLGKTNVIVVIDDVEDGGEQESRIKAEQPSIHQLANAMFLFSRMDKRTDSEDDTENSALLTSNNMEQKLKQINKIIKAHSRRLWWKYYGFLILFSAALLITVAIWLVVYEEV